MNITEVLVVDDDLAICQIVHRMLSNEHCKVQTSQSVAHALALLGYEVMNNSLGKTQGVVSAEQPVEGLAAGGRA
jgi:DNA-binding NtrC family response regulator